MFTPYKRGQTSVILRVKILDSSVATGAGKTGIAYNTSGLIISTICDNESAPTVYTSAATHIQDIATLGTFAAPSASCCRFKEVDSTNHKGIYEIQLDDTRYAKSGAKSMIVSISGPTGCAETDVVIPLVDLDPYTASAAQTGDSYSRLGEPVNGDISADIAAVSAVATKLDSMIETV